VANEISTRALVSAFSHGGQQQVAQAVAGNPRALQQLLYVASGAAASKAAATGSGGSSSGGSSSGGSNSSSSSGSSSGSSSSGGAGAPFPEARSLQSYSAALLAELLAHGHCAHAILSHPW
jgi:hypothetical protein